MASIGRFIAKWILIVCAALLLVIAVMLALTDRVAAGSLVAGLFVVVTLFHYLPQMESFKAYGVEAKWRETLNEAEEILRKLRQSTLASAKLTYMTLGWGSRQAGARLRDKQAVADEVDAALSALNVEPSTVRELKKDFLFFTSYDLFQVFDGIVQLNIEKHLGVLRTRLNSLADGDEARASLNYEIASLQAKQESIDLLQSLKNAEPRAFCLDRLPTAGLPEGDAAVLKLSPERSCWIA